MGKNSSQTPVGASESSANAFENPMDAVLDVKKSFINLLKVFISGFLFYFWDSKAILLAAQAS